MKLHHALFVAAILGGFTVFALAVGCADHSPLGAQLEQGDDGSYTAGDDITILKKTRKKTKRKATRVYKGRMKAKTTKKKASRGIGHMTYRTDTDGQAPFQYGVLIQDLSGVTSAGLYLGLVDDPEPRLAAHLYMSENGNGTNADGFTGLLVRGELTASDLAPYQVSVMELAEYLMMGEAFISVATHDSPSGELAGQLLEVDQTPLKKKFELRE